MCATGNVELVSRICSCSDENISSARDSHSFCVIRFKDKSIGIICAKGGKSTKRVAIFFKIGGIVGNDTINLTGRTGGVEGFSRIVRLGNGEGMQI